MLHIKERPHGLLLLVAIVLLIALVFLPLASFDFQDKTIFSVPLDIMVWIIPLLLIILWLLYLLTKRFLYSMTITRIHVGITVCAVLLMVIVLYLGINPSRLANDRHELIGNVMQILFMLFVGGQFTYLANVLLGLFGKQKS